MMCDRCKKNEASIYYTEIINGEKKEQHICEECAMEYSSFQMSSPFLDQEFTLGSLLSTILGNYSNLSNSVHGTESSEGELRCDGC